MIPVTARVTLVCRVLRVVATAVPAVVHLPVCRANRVCLRLSVMTVVLVELVLVDWCLRLRSRFRSLVRVSMSLLWDTATVLANLLICPSVFLSVLVVASNAVRVCVVRLCRALMLLREMVLLLRSVGVGRLAVLYIMYG